MALPATALIEIRADATANNVNGGGFNPANANFLTDLAATSATGNSPVVTSASYTFEASDDEMWVYVKSGTNWTPGFYQIASVSGGAATLRAAVGEAVQFNSTTGRWGPNTVAGCATTASPTGGTFGVDYTQTTAAIETQADGTAAGTTTFTSALATFRVSMVGNYLHITASTGLTVGWYEIVSFTDANNVVLDRSPGTGSATTFYIGGAMSLNSTLDDDLFETAVATNGTGANVFFIKKAGGTLTLGESIALTAAGASQAPLQVVGYNAIRGDIADDVSTGGDNRPSFTNSVFLFTLAAEWQVRNLIIRGSNTSALAVGTRGMVRNCKATNTSTTADRNGILGGAGTRIMNCEVASYRGDGVEFNGNGGVVTGCYIHDCNNGVACPLGTNTLCVLYSIIENCTTNAISGNATAQSGLMVIENCTLYGAENKLGVGVNMPSATLNFVVVNCNIVGFVTGISHADALPANLEFNFLSDYNNFYNNTTDVTNWKKGPHDIAVDPAFTSVSQVTGTAAKFAGTNDRVIDTTKNFTSLGVVAGDVIRMLGGGTGDTAGLYLIDSITTTTNTNDTLIVTIPAGPGTDTTADKDYQITIGHNFLPTGAI